MNLSIIGASAGIGLELVKLSMAKGHNITTLSRSTETIPDHHLIKKQKGSATSLPDLQTAIAGADAILIAIGKKGRASNTGMLFTDTANTLVKAMQNLKLNVPVVAVTGFGAGDSGAYQTFMMKILFSLLLKKDYDDKTRFEQILSGSSLRWIIARPGILTNKPPTHAYKATTKLSKGMKMGKISRADVAAFMLQQTEKPTHLNQYVSLTN